MQMFYIDGLTDAQNELFFKLVEFKVQYAKLWDSKTGRTATGAFKGRLIGIFPKIEMTIGSQNDTVRRGVLAQLNSEYKDVIYWDTQYNSWVKKTFYFGDAIDEIKRAKSTVFHKQISCDAVATTKRTPDDRVTRSGNSWVSV